MKYEQKTSEAIKKLEWLLSEIKKGEDISCLAIIETDDRYEVCAWAKEDRIIPLATQMVEMIQRNID